jgi:hypothetical protein
MHAVVLVSSLSASIQQLHPLSKMHLPLLLVLTESLAVLLSQMHQDPAFLQICEESWFPPTL